MSGRLVFQRSPIASPKRSSSDIWNPSWSPSSMRIPTYIDQAAQPSMPSGQRVSDAGVTTAAAGKDGELNQPGAPATCLMAFGLAQAQPHANYCALHKGHYGKSCRTRTIFLSSLIFIDNGWNLGWCGFLEF